MAIKKTATKKTATKKAPTGMQNQYWLVYDPSDCGSPQTVYALTPLAAAKEFCDNQSDVLGETIERLHIIAVDDLPLYKFISAGVTMTQVKK